MANILMVPIRLSDACLAVEVVIPLEH